ncbi:ATP synthase delta subunit-domain-containing protein [Fusarium flagelliforme]|nr:ATP synthase delta subunit-domain-containing protein [Fusarium flagelliforme]KAH7186128.1 ATP synthase delta subunit-domain-containing protein [Fusarium flagelliforme]
MNTLLLFLHIQCDTQASKSAQQQNHNQETQVPRTRASQYRTHPNPSATIMFLRQIFSTIRAATLHPTPFLRTGPARNITGATHDSRPPVYLYGLDGTYATALYTAAAKMSTLDLTAKAIVNLSNVFMKDTKLTKVLSTPRLTDEDKSAIVAELSKHTGANVATVKNLLQTLAENNRLGHLQGVCEKFGELMSAKRGEVEMTITSAERLDNKTLSRLETAVSKSSYVGQGKTLKVTNKIDPEIIGGLIVTVGDRTIDLSVYARIAKMNKVLTDML